MPVEVIDQSKKPPSHVVDRGGPTQIAKKWIPKVVGTQTYIDKFPGYARSAYIAATKEGVRQAWRSHKSNGEFPDHRAEPTPDGCYGMFNIKAASLVKTLNEAVEKRWTKEGYESFRFREVN